MTRIPPTYNHLSYAAASVMALCAGSEFRGGGKQLIINHLQNYTPAIGTLMSAYGRRFLFANKFI